MTRTKKDAGLPFGAGVKFQGDDIKAKLVAVLRNVELFARVNHPIRDGDSTHKLIAAVLREAGEDI